VKVLADECCDAPLVRGLRSDGHDVLYAKEIAPGADDEFVLELACSERRILLTEDKDFGELVVRLGMPAYGIL
jgi:predicted nuclease of predicted toxin-antitoxin system